MFKLSLRHVKSIVISVEVFFSTFTHNSSYRKFVKWPFAHLVFYLSSPSRATRHFTKPSMRYSNFGQLSRGQRSNGQPSLVQHCFG